MWLLRSHGSSASVDPGPSGKPWIDAFAEMTKAVWSADVCFRLLSLLVEPNVEMP